MKKQKTLLYNIFILVLIAIISYLVISLKQVHKQSQRLEEMVQQIQLTEIPIETPIEIPKPVSGPNLDEVCRRKAEAFRMVIKDRYPSNEVEGITEVAYLKCRYP